MRFDLVVYLVTGLLFILLVLLLRGLWRGGKSAPATTKSPRVKYKPKPFSGLTRKPECELCEPGTVSHPPAPGSLFIQADLAGCDRAIPIVEDFEPERMRWFARDPF
jgi:hypothetical protein